MNYAIITDGIVTNIIVADAAFAASIGAVPAQDAGIGWSYAGGVFTAPVPPSPIIPQSVTMRQARLALLGAGLLAGVDAAIAGLAEPMKSAALIEWEYVAIVQRSSGLVPAMAAALGMTDTQIDDLFLTASTL